MRSRSLGPLLAAGCSGNDSAGLFPNATCGAVAAGAEAVATSAGVNSTRKNMALLESMIDFESTSLPPSQFRFGASAMAPGEAAGGFQVGGSVGHRPMVTDVNPLVIGGVVWWTCRVSVAESPAAGKEMADTATS